MSSKVKSADEIKADEEITAWIKQNLPNHSKDVLLEEYIVELCDKDGYDCDEVLASLFPKMPSSDAQERSKIVTWLKKYIPNLPPSSAELYSIKLSEEGFDSEDILNKVLKKRNIQFMRKGHKRCLTRLLEAQGGHPGFDPEILKQKNKGALQVVEGQFRKVTAGLPGADKEWERIQSQMSDQLELS